ncbi:hypothetical protein GOODEAATRI_019632, partial [Goodea atripinnis]
YEELRYWYDCLCYKEELRQYHEYISAVKELEDKRQLEVIFFHLLYNTRFPRTFRACRRLFPMWSMHLKHCLNRLMVISAGTYTVSPCLEEAAIVVKCTKESGPTLAINLTSPLVRTEQLANAADGKGVYFCPALTGLFCVFSVRQGLYSSTDLYVH